MRRLRKTLIGIAGAAIAAVIAALGAYKWGSKPVKTDPGTVVTTTIAQTATETTPKRATKSARKRKR